MDIILEAQDLKKIYGKTENQTQALRGISFNVVAGEFLGIMGSSGSGKTTLLNCIATVTKPTSGQIFLNGRDLLALKGKDLAEYRGKKIGYLFQNFELIDNLTGLENILLPLAMHGVNQKESQERIDTISTYLDIQDVLDKFPAQMSGGQKQRIATARATILNPSIILADEPTGALDSKNSKILMEKLSLLNEKEESTILMVTHDAAAASYCSRILFMQDGQIIHELRKDDPHHFYKQILEMVSQLGGGSSHVL